MCEYCGCQALQAIDELTQEHDRVVTLISRVGDAHAGGNVALMAEVAREIAALLGPHTRVEEEGLFPALAADFPEQMAELESEHRRIEAVLAEADGPFLADPTWPQRLIETLALLRDHILKEQDGVFPAALAYLTIEQWEAVEAVRARTDTRISPSP
ncbi:hemerythrin domain-containing protein [Streptomyces nodosus]|uniref:Hemerythrin HHE cation-binding protein n=1 Tax=Streptomyces nodosus TaxID=40318 RepID=A0A0B5DSV3_9ACTN|nr:hemerythrin domain-containing protein [Streptomyces nodosus]AJE44380.1 hemerythrin HHE cation-binding protein [Streptomyces nodosus]MBB4796017.1 hemerythrin-like domain-containing protein [Streptomyces nodosus]QEV42868.1 hemerythrin domain-containing protein [Streptomyces nodosus]